MQKLSLNLLDSFINNKIEQQDFSKNTKKSIPLVTRKGDKLFYAIFLFDDTILEHKVLKRPFAWVLLPVDAKNTLDFSFNYCSLTDFVNTDSYPLDENVSASVGDNESTEFSRDRYFNELVVLMMEISGFAFKETITELQQESINRFKDLFLQTAYIGFYGFYQAIAADFFDWINFTIVAQSDNHTIKKELEQDMLTKLLETNTSFGVIEEKLATLEEMQISIKNILTNNEFEIEKEIILIIDHINKSIARFPTVETNNQYKELELVKAIRQDLIDLLYRHNIEPYKVSENNINLNFQKVIETKLTNDKELNRTVCKRLAVGWSRGNTVIRPEHIIAYLCDDSLA